MVHDETHGIHAARYDAINAMLLKSSGNFPAKPEVADFRRPRGHAAYRRIFLQKGTHRRRGPGAVCLAVRIEVHRKLRQRLRRHGDEAATINQMEGGPFHSENICGRQGRFAGSIVPIEMLCPRWPEAKRPVRRRSWLASFPRGHLRNNPAPHFGWLTFGIGQLNNGSRADRAGLSFHQAFEPWRKHSTAGRT